MLNSLILTAHLLNPNTSASDLRQQLVNIADDLALMDTEIKICIDQDCEILPNFPKPASQKTRMMWSDVEGEDGPNVRHEPGAPLPMVPPKLTREAGGQAIEMIMGKLSSMTAIEGGIEVEYHHKDPKTGEETDLKVKVNGSMGKATGK